ncbi:MAG: Cro/CI family transcriptional regulator [Shewanella sp.]
MTITDAAKHFGNRSKLARALGITPAAVYMRQKADGDVLPEEWAMKLHFLTGGELAFTPEKYQQSSDNSKVTE